MYKTVDLSDCEGALMTIDCLFMTADCFVYCPFYLSVGWTVRRDRPVSLQPNGPGRLDIRCTVRLANNQRRSSLSPDRLAWPAGRLHVWKQDVSAAFSLLPVWRCSLFNGALS